MNKNEATNISAQTKTPATEDQIKVVTEQFNHLMFSTLCSTRNVYTKVMVFIDAGYLKSSLESYHMGGIIDYSKIIEKLVNGRQLLRTYYYTAKIEKPPTSLWERLQQEQQRLFSSIAHQPYMEVRLGRLQFTKDGEAHQKGVDVLIAIDMLRFAIKHNYDTAILLSGDGDFADIIRMVKDEGRLVEIATFDGSKSFALQSACDVCTEITKEWLKDCHK